MQAQANNVIKYKYTFAVLVPFLTFHRFFVDISVMFENNNWNAGVFSAIVPLVLKPNQMPKTTNKQQQKNKQQQQQ